MRFLSVLVFVSFSVGCASLQSENDQVFMMEVYPFGFSVDQPVSRVHAIDTEGAALEFGEVDNAFFIFKSDASELFANAPAQVGVGNRDFLELLLSSDTSSKRVNTIRKIFLGEDLEKVKTIEKGDWLFVVTMLDEGATAYGARNSFNRVYQFNHSRDFDGLVKLIEGAELLIEE